MPTSDPKGQRRPASREGDSEGLRITADFQFGPTTAEWRRLMDRLMSPVLEGKDQGFVGTADGYDCSDLLDGDKEPAQE